MFGPTLLDHPPRSPSSMEAALVIGESLIFSLTHFSAPSTFAEVTLSFSLIYCPLPVTGHRSPCFPLHVNPISKGGEETGKAKDLLSVLQGKTRGEKIARP